MIRRTLAGLSLCLAALALPRSGAAQSFQMQKYDIGGEGGTDYIVAEPGTGRVFVSRGNHVMVVDGMTGKVLGDIPDTPRMHGVGIAPKWNHGFTTNGGDTTVTMFDLKTLAPIRKIKIDHGGLDGIMYDADDDLIILTNHSRPVGTLTAINPNTGAIVGTAELEDIGPEGAAADGKGHIFVNNEGKSTIQVIDVKTWKATASWSLAPCDGPTGIAYDKASNRIFSGCSDHSVVVVHQDSPDKYTTVATVTTVPGAKTIGVDPVKHVAYLFQPEYGPAPGGAPAGGRGRGPRGPMVAAWFVSIKP